MENLFRSTNKDIFSEGKVGDGVCIVAYGRAALAEAHGLIRSIKKNAPLPISLITENYADAMLFDKYKIHKKILYKDEPFSPGVVYRRAKLLLDLITPYQRTLYLDADTRVKSNKILQGFRFLDAGWDLVIAPSKHQLEEAFSHISREERNYMLDKGAVYDTIQLQAGVFWFDFNFRTRTFFQVWRNEWLRFHLHDQAAFVRALNVVPIRIYLVGKPFNSRRGTIVDHQFGRARL